MDPEINLGQLKSKVTVFTNRVTKMRECNSSKKRKNRKEKN